METNDEIRSVAIVGSGNVAEAFAVAAAACEGLELRGVAARNAARAEEIARMAGCPWSALDAAPAADLYVIAVSDRAVGEAAAALPLPDGATVAHTAGSVPIEALAAACPRHACGVIYPFQTFTAGRRVDFAEVPLFTEGADGRTEQRLARFASRLSCSVTHASSQRRRTIHLAGVLACNFVNALYSMAADTLHEREGLPFDVLRPIIAETARKAASMEHPRSGQTGPAARGDAEVTRRHEAMLAGEPLEREIYRLLTRYIWETSRRT